MCENIRKKMVQIHCHSSSSLLDGTTSVDKLVKRAKELGHTALALTDHGSATALFDLAKECKKQGIKPIFGLEFYINNDLRSRVSHKDRETVEDRDYHQSVYIKNKEGYVNFNYLNYIANTEGYYYKARIDFDLLFERKEGLMATSSCMASKIGNYVRQNKHKEAEDLFKRYVKEFGDDFYGEIQFNEVEGQKEINDLVIHLSNKYDVKLLIGGDVHYLNPGDGALQDALIASKRESSGTDWTISARHLYFHDSSDYYDFNQKFGFNYDEKLIETALENSLEFADKPNFEFETGKYHLPKIDTGKFTSRQYLEKVAWEGITKNIETERKYFPDKYSDVDIEKIEEQVEYELNVLDNLGVVDYMLMVHEIIKWEKEQGFYVGPGRGSCAGSTIAWAAGITTLNPIEHGLLFERFINPTRRVAPDIDWDNSAGAREAILTYLVEKYGQESVCNVATFGTFGTKSGLQAMSRGLKKDTAQDSVLMRKITKLEGLEDTKDLVKFFENIRRKSDDGDILRWIDSNKDTIEYASRINGQITQLGMHAGGIVVTPGPIYNFIPVTRGNGNLITAFREADGSSKDLGELGILKLDVLGLKTLNFFKYCVENIKKDKGIDLAEKIWYLDLKDKKIIDYFANESSYGIFQMDRAKMFTSKIKVDSFDDMAAINALNRPGPLEKYLNKYGYWKEIDKGNLKVDKEELERINKERYPFPFMEKVLSSTYGCLLYQEEFMFLVKEAAGFDMGEADNFRRGIAWLPDNPKYHTVEKYFEKLENGMKEKGYTKEDSDYFVKYCRDFMGYSFCKSHAYCYSYVTFQTLFFKVYYPAYFYAAMINFENDIEKFQEIISDAEANGIKVLTHSINKSEYLTKAESDDSIRLGFSMIKGMGGAVKDEFDKLQLNNYSDLHEVLKLDFGKVNNTQFQNLIDLGAFDDFEVDREQIPFLKSLYTDGSIEKWFTRKNQTLRLEVIPKVLKDNFGQNECLSTALKIKSNHEPWKLLISELIKKVMLKPLDKKKYLDATLKKQKELMGFSLLSGLKLSSDVVSSFRVKGVLPLFEFEDEEKTYYFIVEKVTIAYTKTQKKFLQLVLNDGKQNIKAKCWRDIGLIEQMVYQGKFKKDNYGFTLSDREVTRIL